MVGSAILRQLADHEGHEIVTRTHAELDLTAQPAVRDFMQSEQPDVVIWLLQKWVAFMPIIPTLPISFIKT